MFLNSAGFCAHDGRNYHPAIRAIAHTVARDSPTPVDHLFDVVVAEDVLPKVLHRWGPVPAVTGTQNLTGPWDTPGSSRTVELEDGSTARETVLAWNRPHTFSYRVDQFTSALAGLVDHAVGSWRFESTADGSRLTWTYTFKTASTLAGAPLQLFVRTAWARYMAQCADLCVALATETASPPTR